MMEARDYTKSSETLEGKSAFAMDRECACRPCFGVGKDDKGYVCKRLHEEGCPDRPEYIPPHHIHYPGETHCRRCGKYLEWECPNCSSRMKIGRKLISIPEAGLLVEDLPQLMALDYEEVYYCPVCRSMYKKANKENHLFSGSITELSILDKKRINYEKNILCDRS